MKEPLAAARSATTAGQLVSFFERRKETAERISDCMPGNSKTSQTTPTGASSLGIAVIPGKCAISSVIGCYYLVITGFDLG